MQEHPCAARTGSSRYCDPHSSGTFIVSRARPAADRRRYETARQEAGRRGRRRPTRDRVSRGLEAVRRGRRRPRPGHVCCRARRVRIPRWVDGLGHVSATKNMQDSRAHQDGQCGSSVKLGEDVSREQRGLDAPVACAQTPLHWKKNFETPAHETLGHLPIGVGLHPNDIPERG